MDGSGAMYQEAESSCRQVHKEGIAYGKNTVVAGLRIHEIRELISDSRECGV